MTQVVKSCGLPDQEADLHTRVSFNSRCMHARAYQLAGCSQVPEGNICVGHRQSSYTGNRRTELIRPSSINHTTFIQTWLKMEGGAYISLEIEIGSCTRSTCQDRLRESAVE